MSDDFDKEAERERLREKYERDQQKRQATQRMSDLLLKGATMTNRHCDQCGDPVFRYQGTEFCPSCQDAVPAEGDEAPDTSDAPDGEPADKATAGSVEQAPPAGTQNDRHRAESRQQPGQPDADDAVATTGQARNALEQALARHATLAAETDDPQKATQHLAAAREAAEALAVLTGS